MADEAIIGNRRRGAAIALAIFAVDQLVKWYVAGPLDLRAQPQGRIEILSFFDLNWTENRGVSMGLLTASSETMQWLLVALTGAIALFVAFWMWREKQGGDAAALALVLGGALGNILDRVRFGYVVDFADLHFGEWRPFLVFNVADAAITIGVLLLLVRALLLPSRKTNRKEV